jgi:hypothetical protein
MISSINDKAAEAARMMTEWAADELRRLCVAQRINPAIPLIIFVDPC